MAFTKLFSDLLGSTVWREPDHVRLVWITMLAATDQDGEVHASIPGLADFARVSVEDCENALNVLSAPDEYSRTKDHDGRRIQEIDGGWIILNYDKYRQKASSEEVRKKAAKRAKRYRDRRSGVTERDAGVTERDAGVTRVTNHESNDIAEAEAEAEVKRKNAAHSSPPTANASVSWSAENGWSGITERQTERWKEAYPACDLKMQFAQMDEWLRNNPQKARKSRWSRFISNWLKRHQDRGGDVKSQNTKSAARYREDWFRRFNSKREAHLAERGGGELL